MAIGSGALNSKLAIREIFEAKDDPTKEAKKAATNAVKSIGIDKSPREKLSCRS